MKIVWKISSLTLMGIISTTALATTTAYPDRSVTLVVPYPPGGTTDILARLISTKLSQQLGQTFVVENKPGAGGQIGSRLVARAKPDGYTLLMGTINSHGINAALYKELPYRTIEDFAPISMVADAPNVLIASKKAPFKNFEEMLAFAKENPTKLSFGSTSLGGSPHMAGELLKNRASLSMLHIPYQGGGPMISDLIGGQIPIGFDNLPSSAPQIKSGNLEALAVTTKERWPSFPDIPSISEFGINDYEVASWFGVLAPAQTPTPILEKLSKAISSILEEDEVKSQLLNLGARPVGNSPEEFQQQIIAEVDKWSKVVQDNKLEQL